MTDFTLYGSQASLFTGKARAYLNWKGVSFEEVAVNAKVMKEVILPSVGWPVIPVVKMPDGKIVQDTADIINAIEARHPKPPVMPASPVLQFASQLMQVYADQWLTVPAMHYRWNYNEEWIFGEFGRSIAPDADAETQYEVGKKSGMKFRAMVPMLGITPETVPAIEASYEAFLQEFADHLAVHPFVFGGRPSYADFALYGPLYAHLYRDPESRKIMERAAPSVARWVERVGEGETLGTIVEGDEVPPTLLPIFRRHFKEHLPVLVATQALVDTWVETAEPGAEIPRMLGVVPFEIEGMQGNVIARPFSLFRLQMALDVLEDMRAEDRKSAEAFLRSVGAESLIDFKSTRRMERRNCKLCLAVSP